MTQSHYDWSGVGVRTYLPTASRLLMCFRLRGRVMATGFLFGSMGYNENHYFEREVGHKQFYCCYRSYNVVAMMALVSSTVSPFR